MSAETGTPSSSHPLPATPDQPTVEVKTMDQEALPLVNKVEEEDTARAEKLPDKANLAPDTEREIKNKQTEPPAVEIKDIAEAPVVGVPVQDKREEEKDCVPVSHTIASPEPVAEAIDSQPVEQQAMESVVKEEVERLSLEKEQQEQVKTAGAPESSVEASEKPQQQSEILHVKESESVTAKDLEDSVVAKQVDKPERVVPEVDAKVEEQFKKNATAEDELKVVEQPEVYNQAEKLEPVEKPQEPSEFLPVKEPEAIVEKSVEGSKTETKEAGEPELTVPEIKMKLDEQSKVTNQDEKTEPVPEVQVKLDRQAESSEQVKSGSIERETSKDEGILAGRVEDTTLGKEGKTGVQKESSAIAEPVISTDENAQADVPEDQAGHSPAVVAEEHEKKETDGTEPVVLPSKVAVGEGENIREEREEKNIATEGDNVQRELPNEELAQPIQVEEVKNAVSSAEVIAKQLEGEKIGEVIEPVVENKKDEIIIGERSALVGTGKEENVELDETTKTNEDNLVKETVEETAKSDVQISEPSTKDGNDTKAPRELPPEVPAKPTQKQSGNILAKVKHSLVKAKKAIIGKSPSPKTVSSDVKDDINVK